MDQHFPFNDHQAIVLRPANYLDEGREGLELTVALAQAIADQEIRLIVVDCQEVIDVDANVLGILGRVHCSCRLNNRRFRLANTRQIDAALQDANLDQMFDLRLNVKDALYG